LHLFDALGNSDCPVPLYL